jgi:hypothetical protein
MNPNIFQKYLHLCDLALHYKINQGYCPICEHKTYFVQFSDWLRDYYNAIIVVRFHANGRKYLLSIGLFQDEKILQFTNHHPVDKSLNISKDTARNTHRHIFFQRFR